jgi:hypothetical protein
MRTGRVLAVRGRGNSSKRSRTNWISSTRGIVQMDQCLEESGQLALRRLQP